MKKKIYSLSILFLATVFHAIPAGAQYISSFAGNGFGAGTGMGGYAGDGSLAASAKLSGCTGVAVDGAGNIYIADRGNNVVRKVNTMGIISTFAGTGIAGYSGNGGNATLANLNAPSAVATDAAGNVYIADMGNHVIRKVNTIGKISGYAGNGIQGYTGNGGGATDASLNTPQGIALDASGNLYIADAGNNVIRKVDVTNAITTYAGNSLQGNSGDGGLAVAAKLYGPSGVATDAFGNVYIADYFNNVVRKVSSVGIITRFAGTGAAGNNGDGGAATSAALSYPASVSVDAAGTVFIADQGNNNIRTVSASGVISHYAGASANDYTGNGGLAAIAKLGAPKCVFADGWGRVYIAEYNNHVVRVITAEQPTSVNNVTTTGTSIYPNPANGTFTVRLPMSAKTAQVTVSDVMGRIVATKEITNGVAADFGTMTPGNYIVSVITTENTYTEKLVIGN